MLGVLENLIHEPFESRVVKGGDVVDFGDGHELKFIMAPNLHWPDTMFYVRSEVAIDVHVRRVRVALLQ